jgi:hypothetical protein
MSEPNFGGNVETSGAAKRRRRAKATLGADEIKGV